MELFRILGFAVSPQRTSDEKILPSGGAFAVTAEIKNALGSLMESAKLGSQSVVDFQTDPSDDSGQRKHIVRDQIIQIAFGTSAQAKTAATRLAESLAACMDKRSPETLLMVAASRDGRKLARATLWAFPQEEAFQFRPLKKGATVKLLSDIFSQSSRLRKAALFEGENIRSHFWQGRVLDLQTTGSYGKAADYWIRDFLKCRLGLEGDAGTRILADAIRKTYDQLSSDADREQLYGAIVAVRTSPKRTWSARQFARQYLEGDLQNAFLSHVSPDLQPLSFQFSRKVFEDRLNFRVFRLDNGAFVSAPISAIDNGVTILEGKERRLRCEGAILEEHVRSRRA